MADPYFFGYGSLVNTATHDFPDPHPARISGWRRAWRHTDLHPLAILSAVPDPMSDIDGMIAHVPQNNWAVLDQREWAYDRIAATPSVTHPLDRALDIALYAVPDASQSKSNIQHPILLSYLDVVVQGYLRAFGQDGADRFFATTDGWDSPILNDRSDPQYPRHQNLRADETSFVNDKLTALGSFILSP